jgi:hypothetical protein
MNAVKGEEEVEGARRSGCRRSRQRR